MRKISNAEYKILKIIWKEKECTSLDISTKIGNRWNSNTIRTFLKRLLDKGVIGISKKIGKTYYYYSIINEKEYKFEQVRIFIKDVFDGNIEEIKNILNFYSR